MAHVHSKHARLAVALWALSAGASCGGDTPRPCEGPSCDDAGPRARPPGGSSGGGASSAGSGGSAAASGRSGAAMDASSEAEGHTHGCENVRVSGRRIIPNVIFLIDQSSSMNDHFAGGQSRWDALKDTLLAEDGPIAALQSDVRFGVTLFSARDEATCPLLTSEAHAFDNLDAIRETFGEAQTVQETPTGDAIDAVLDRLLADGTVDPNPLDRDLDPTVFVVATDGEPDTCAQLNPQQGQAASVAAVERAHAVGVRTYVVGVATARELSDAHLTELANAGLGVQPGEPDAKSFRVDDAAGLESAIEEIIGSRAACQVRLEGEVLSGNPCEGEVLLDGAPLQCDEIEGWRLTDPGTVELFGEACERLQAGGYLEAVFNCEVVELY